MPDPSMNNHIIPNKRVLMIATMLSAMMLAASMTSLVPTKAFAQDIASGVIERVNESLPSQVNPNSDSGGEQEEEASGDDSTEAEAARTGGEQEEEASGDDSTETAATPVAPEDSDINLSSESQEETSSVEEDEFVTVEPIIQTSIQPDINVGANVGLVMDEEDCEEAQNEVVQGNGQVSEQKAHGEGRVGDNDIYVSPKVQLSEQIALNAYVDVDVVLVEGCDPKDTVVQANGQKQTQGISSDLKASDNAGHVEIPAHQRADKFAYNVGVNRDVVMPVL